VTADAISVPPAASPSRPAGPAGNHYGIRHVLRSEWTKLRSVRSTAWCLIITVLLTIAIGILTTSVEVARWHHLSIIDRIEFDPVRLSLTGTLLGQLAIGVLGILVITAEYGTGSIRSTLAAIPNRPLVAAAKALVFAAVALVVTEAVAFVAFFIGQTILSGTAPHAVLGQPGVLRSVMGSGLYLTVLGLLGLGLGLMIRHTAGAISTFVGLLLILPLIVSALPTSVADKFDKYLPANIGLSMITTNPQPGSDLLDPWAGFGLLCLYAAVIFGLGVVVLVRKDA
jgi:ABC-2 type transport system permease protein